MKPHDMPTDEIPPVLETVASTVDAMTDPLDHGNIGLTSYVMISWLAETWAPAVETELRALAEETWTISARLHYLNITILTAFFVLTLAIASIVAVILL